MYRQVILFIFLSPVLCLAMPKDLAALMSESQKTRAEAAKERTFEKKSQKFKEFQSSLNSTLKEYEAANPEEGTSAEEKVAKFSYRFEPLFPLAHKKPNKETCVRTRSRIEFEDKSGKGENAKLSDNAVEALKWLDVLCK